jgi:crossover junction endodeoxyribonuclease RuvC
MRVLGIDPGLRITGYACLEPAPSTSRSTPIPRIVEAGVFRLAPPSSAPPSSTHTSPAPTSTPSILSTRRPPPSISARLLELDTDFRELLARTRPDLVAVESLFAHPKHPATSIIMAHARGVLLLATRAANLPLLELRPATIKKALTGSGQAPKAQMQAAIQTRFALKDPPHPPDLADALAIALCALERARA